MSILEAGMMFCFGISWPFQVVKTYKTKNVKGKSILFLWFVEAGYLMGMAHKVIYNMDAVIYLYALNFLLVGTDMVLYYLYKNRSENNDNDKFLGKTEYKSNFNGNKEAELKVSINK